MTIIYVMERITYNEETHEDTFVDNWTIFFLRRNICLFH